MLNFFISNPNIFLILLISIGLIGILAIFYFSRKRGPKLKKEKGAIVLLHLDSAEPSSTMVQDTHAENADSISVEFPSRKPTFATLQGTPGMPADFLRAFLIILSIVVATGSLLTLLPQRTIDQMAQNLQSRHGVARTERIALLYLGDETKEGTLRIRGVVRNITASPIEQLDAAIRFYARNGNLLETILVRMDKETIAPDEIARLELVVPNHAMQYTGYALEFKLRQGETLAYKDMRGDRSLQ